MTETTMEWIAIALIFIYGWVKFIRTAKTLESKVILFAVYPILMLLLYYWL